MKDFAKLFNSETLGQILVTKEYDHYSLDAYRLAVRRFGNLGNITTISAFATLTERDSIFDDLTLEGLETRTTL